MALANQAAGYASVDAYFTPPQLTGEIVYNYHQCALTPRLAKSDFLAEEDLVCGSRVIFGREEELEWFGYATDNNEDPPVTFGPRVKPDSLTICRDSKFQVKISKRDLRILCENKSKWMSLLERQIDKQIIMEIDGYSLPIILGAAHPDNVGKKAGMLNHTVDLGGQGGSGNTPLPTTTISDFARIMDNLIEVASQAGWMCDPAETATSGGGVANPVVVLPSKLRGLAKEYIRSNQFCCDSSAAEFRSGKIGMIEGMDIIVSQRLQPFSAVGGSGLVAPVLMCDPNQILHAFEFITNDIWKGKFDEFFVGEYIYDTHVINPYGLVTAYVAIN